MAVKEVLLKAVLGNAVKIWPSIQKWYTKKDLGNYCHKYEMHLWDHAGKIKILGMEEPVPVEDIFIDINMLEKTTRNLHIKEEELDQAGYGAFSDFGKTKERKNALEVVKNTPKLFILGKPGAGKSTFLKHITISTISDKVNVGFIPVFISLKEFSEDKKANTLLKQIVKEFEKNGFPKATPFVEEALKEGSFAILLDGLDEVSEAESARTCKEINSATRQYSENRFIITCRNNAYNYIFEDYTDVELADFDDDQITEFVKKWFANNSETGEKCLTKLMHADNKGIKEMASQPLLLTLLCIYFKDARDFPQNRAELYEEAVKVLLQTWDSSRGIERSSLIYKKLSPRQKLVLYSEIAAPAFNENKYFFKENEIQYIIAEKLDNLVRLEKEIDAGKVLRAMIAHHGILAQRARKVYSFAHLSFQEFFCAFHYAQKPVEELVDLHITDNHWREVFILLAGLLLNSDNFILAMKRKADSIIQGDDALTDILREVAEAVDSVKDDAKYKEYKPSSMRVLSLFSARDLAFNPTLSFDHDLVRDLGLALTRDHDLARDLTNALANDRVFGDARDLVRALEAAQTTKLKLYLKANLRMVECMNSAVQLSREVRDSIEATILVPD